MTSYIDGFVAAVSATDRQAYVDFATRAGALFREFGAARVVDCWPDDVPDGEVTDFRGAVKAGEGEVVVFSWIEWPSKAAREAGQRRMREDPRMRELGEAMPFDGKRLIYGGFVPVLDA